MKKIMVIIAMSFLVGCATSPPKQYQSSLKGVALYGYLMKSGNGDYRFSKFQITPSAGAWVRLNDGKPMWNTNCDGQGKYCRTNANLFILGGVFYEGEYLDAYEEAIDSLEGGNGRIQSAITDLNQRYVEFNEVRDRYKMSVRDAETKVKFDIAVEDRTGLYDNNNTIFRRHNSNFSISSPINPYISSSIDGTDFNQMVSNYKKALENKVRLIKATDTMNVTCRYSGTSKFHVSFIKCPSSIPRSQSKIFAKPVISRVTYKQVIPSSLKGADKYISYNFNGSSVKVVNNTNQFISVSSVSFYHNNKIATNEGINYDLPPKSVKDVVYLNDMRVNEEAITFYNVTKTSAQGTEVPYGIAIKYKLGNGESKTLYDSFNFSLYDLIK